MTISFIAVRNHKRADGYLVVGKQMFPARSGRNLSDVTPERLAYEAGKKTRKLQPGEHKFIDFAAERGDVPPGTYQLGEPTPISSDNRLTMSRSKSTTWQYKKFSILPFGASRHFDAKGRVDGVLDDRYPAARTELLFHFDGDVIGSAGCIVYDEEVVQTLLERAHAAHDRSVEVIHVGNDAEAKALAEQKLAAQLAAH